MENPSKPHPLLLDHVVENIFGSSIITKWDLLAIRQVCVSWNIAASKQWTISLRRTEESLISRMEKLILFLQNPESSFSFITKFYISADFFPEYDEEDFHTTFCKLLGSIANQLEFLRVEVRESSELIFLSDSYKNIGSFNRLQTLESEVQPNYLHPKRSEFLFVPHLIGTLLENAPGLKNLKISWYTTSSRLNWPHLGDKVLSKIPKSVQRLVIRHLQFAAHDVEIFSSLILPNLKSLSLELRFYNLDLTGDHVYNLFANSKNETLMELALTLHIFPPIPGFKLPVFPNVHSLKLGELGIGRPLPAEDMSLLRLFPKVTHVDLTDMLLDPKLLMALMPTGAIISQVKTCNVYLDQHKYFDGLIELTKLVIQVPISLRKLGTVGEVFGQSNGIEHLELEFEEWDVELGSPEFLNLDSILTGIPAGTCESIRTNPQWREFPLATIKVKPGISDLKNLKKLSIKSRIPANITDVTVQFGILQLPKLKDLVVDEFNMSQGCIQDLKLKFGDRVIRRHMCRRLNI